LLTRNIKIVGDDVEGYGCHFATRDSVEFDLTTGGLITRAGQSILDNIEMYNCSQSDSMDAALRFEETGSRPSSVTNSAIHNGMGWAMNIKNSRNIEIQNNVIFNFRPVGIAVDVS